MQIHIHQGTEATTVTVTVTVTLNGNYPHNSTARVLGEIASAYPRQKHQVTFSADEDAVQHSVSGDPMPFVDAVNEALEAYSEPTYAPEPLSDRLVWP